MSQRYIGGLIYNPPGGFSGYFDGNDDLNSPSNAAFTYGTSDFTIEGWFFITGRSGPNSYEYLFAQGSSTGTSSLGLYREGGVLKVWNGSAVITGTTTLALNTWNHIALSRSGTTMRLFLNGVQEGSATNSNSISTGSTYGISVGRWTEVDTNYIVGYVSNFRVVKGTAVYTSAFTPPVGPLQAITNTSLLTCAYPTFRDGSSNNFTITVNGNTAVSTQNPFPQTQLPNPALGNQGNGVYSMSQYQALRSQSLWPSIDQYWPYVTMMLHGNGTNGAQNNTFLDSSTNNFTITRNGNTTQGTFTPYGANWSNFFDGNGDYLSAASNAAFAPGTGDFTIECWVNLSSIGTYNGFFQNTNSTTAASTDKFFFAQYNNLLVLYTHNGGSAAASAPWSPSIGVWYHVAAVRQSGTIKLFINGVQQTVTGSTTFNGYSLGQAGASIGMTTTPFYFNGYISNLRYVVGTAVYTASFTLPTAPVTAVTNTQILTCQSNRFIDNSGNAYTITANGDTSVQRFSPFAPTAPYAADVIGGSGYFDGVGDYLNCGSNAALRPGTSDYTIEMWVYLPTFSTDMYLITQDFNNAGGSFGNFLFYADNTTGTCKFFSSTTGSSWNVINALNMGTLRTNEWTHFAVARQSGTVRTFRNGDLIASTSDGSADLSNTGNLLIATYGANIDTNAYMSGIRLQKGTAQYTASFTCPTAPPTAITNTSLLLNFTNGGIIDNAMMNDLETVGNAQISTSVSKFGGGSLAFDGSGDYLVSAATNLPFTFNTGDFTVECWLYPASVSGGTITIVSNRFDAGADTVLIFAFGTTNGLFFHTQATAVLNSGTNLTANTWQHVALCRAGGTVRIFLNGVQVGSSVSSAQNLSATASVFVGQDGTKGAGAAAQYNGYIDDLRITKYARYTANFTPQRSQWQDQ